MLTFSHCLIATKKFNETKSFFSNILNIPIGYENCGFMRFEQISLHKSPQEGFQITPVFYHENPDFIQKRLAALGMNVSACRYVTPKICTFDITTKDGLEISVSNAGYHKT